MNSEDFKIRDPVFFLNRQVLSKHDRRWKKGCYILEKRSPVTYYIKNQLTGKVYRTHANNMRKALTDWSIAPASNNYMTRRVTRAEFCDRSSVTSDHERSETETSFYYSTSDGDAKANADQEVMKLT